MRFNFLFPRLLVGLASAALVGTSECATVSGTIGIESASGLLPYVVGVGGVNPDPLILPDDATTYIAFLSGIPDLEGSCVWITSISESRDSFGTSPHSWVASDSSSACGYLVSLARSDPQNTAAWLLSVSMGSSETRPDSVRMAIEAWIANSENGESSPWDIIESDRYRGRRGELTQGLYGIGGKDSIPSVWTSGFTMIYNDGVVASVPEPSPPLLIVLACLGLLTRRWRIPAHALS